MKFSLLINHLKDKHFVKKLAPYHPLWNLRDKQKQIWTDFMVGWSHKMTQKHMQKSGFFSINH